MNNPFISMASHQEILQALIDTVNTFNPERLNSFVSPHFEGQDCALPDPLVGFDGLKTTLEIYQKAFPDIQLEIVDTQIADPGITAFWKACGTHTGPWLNIPPTGRKVTIEGIWMMTIDNGCITRARSQWDVAKLLRELGLLPDL